MNKKILVVVIIFILIGGVSLVFFMSNKNINNSIGEFKLLDYQSFVKNHPSDKMVNKIDNATVAKNQAEEIWVDIYGENIKDKRPYLVSYDSLNQVWLVTGTLSNKNGGVPYILFQSDGRVLAVWHDK